MIDWIRREAIYLWYYLDIQIRQIAPYWALGILLGSAAAFMITGRRGARIFDSTVRGFSLCEKL